MKKIKEFRIEHIDNFTYICGYFNNNDPEVNNGYNCDHSDCEDYEIIDDKKVGKCYAFGCPLVPEADKEDLKDYDMNLLKEYQNDEEIHDYVVVSNKDFPVLEG